MKVTKENVADSTMLKPLVEEAAPAHVSKVIADGAYDTKQLSFTGWQRHRACHQGAQDHLFQGTRMLATKGGCVGAAGWDVKLWKTMRGYGMRWMPESAFSSMKRTLDEYVKSVRWKNMVNELLLKTSIYNTFMGMASA